MLPRLDPRSSARLWSMRQATLRPEVFCEEMPAPQRIAPYSSALSADVTVDDEDLGTGRLILLHDPAGNDAWNGTFRCVAYARADIDPELGSDPMLAAVGWSWLTEALEAHGAASTPRSPAPSPASAPRASAGWPTRTAPPRSRSARRGRPTSTRTRPST